MRVVAAVIEGPEEGTVWAFRRAPGRSHAGAYEFPGGKVEPGEGDAEALSRELREELSVTAVIGAKIHEQKAQHAPGQSFDIAFYRVEVDTDPSRHLVDHDDARLLSMDELDGIAWAPGDEDLVHVLASLLSR